jgi:hypothetical protein
MITIRMQFFQLKETQLCCAESGDRFCCFRGRFADLAVVWYSNCSPDYMSVLCSRYEMLIPSDIAEDAVAQHFWKLS